MSATPPAFLRCAETDSWPVESKVTRQLFVFPPALRRGVGGNSVGHIGSSVDCANSALGLRAVLIRQFDNQGTRPDDQRLNRRWEVVRRRRTPTRRSDAREYDAKDEIPCAAHG
jgi:hypothetical protein